MSTQIRKAWPLLLLLVLFSACAAEEAAEPATASERPVQTPATPTSAAEREPLATAATGNDQSEPFAEETAATTRFPAEKYSDLEMVTLLPRDAIPAIDNPQFLTIAAADAYYDPGELIIGVEFEGEARAYSVPFLSNHEIVNDTVGGVKIAVTW